MGTANHTSPVAIDGIVYFAETTFNATCFDAKLKAKELWSSESGAEVFGSPLLYDGLLFTATGKGKLFAFAATGMGKRTPIVKARPVFEETDIAVDHNQPALMLLHFQGRLRPIDIIGHLLL